MPEEDFGIYLAKIIFNQDKKGFHTLLKALFGDIQPDSTSTDDNSKSHPLYLMDTYTGYDSHSDNNITINGLAKLLHFRSYAEAKGDVAALIAKTKNRLEQISHQNHTDMGESLRSQVVENMPASAAAEAALLPFEILHVQDISNKEQPWPAKLCVLGH